MTAGRRYHRRRMRGGRTSIALACAAAIAAGGGVVALTHGDEADARGGQAAATTTKVHRFGGDPTGRIGAVVRRTRYGVPHIVAKDYESASYASAYAFA